MSNDTPTPVVKTKTGQFNLFLIMSGMSFALLDWLAQFDWTQVVPVEFAPLVLSGIGFVGLALRIITRRASSLTGG